mmetsp:Transcript_2018/g.2634  ORF Transcript_2018/g.2634 Transcript_2018/m.2634 type:complete len:228 (-) Transcript_2018:863-1546(-)
MPWHSGVLGAVNHSFVGWPVALSHFAKIAVVPSREHCLIRIHNEVSVVIITVEADVYASKEGNAFIYHHKFLVVGPQHGSEIGVRQQVDIIVQSIHHISDPLGAEIKSQLGCIPEEDKDLHSLLGFLEQHVINTMVVVEGVLSCEVQTWAEVPVCNEYPVLGCEDDGDHVIEVVLAVDVPLAVDLLSDWRERLESVASSDIGSDDIDPLPLFLFARSVQGSGPKWRL